MSTIFSVLLWVQVTKNWLNIKKKYEPNVSFLNLGHPRLPRGEAFHFTPSITPGISR